MFDPKEDKKYDEMYNAYINAGNADEVTKLEGQVSAGGGGGFEKGDHIDWPSGELKFLSVKIRKDSKKGAQGLIVKVTPETGVARYQIFFPSSLTKSVKEIEVDDQNKPVKEKDWLRAGGEAAKEYQNYANMSVDDSFKKFIKDHPNGLNVTEVHSIDTYVFNDKTAATKARLYDYAFA